MKNEHLIDTVEGFLAHLGEGSEFYTMRSYLNKPYSIDGPLTIVKLSTAKEIFGYSDSTKPVIIYTNGDYQTKSFVSDLVNRWHGVFTDLVEAQKYFEERKLAYETDPELIEEAQEAREFHKTMVEEELYYMRKEQE